MKARPSRQDKEVEALRRRVAELERAAAARDRSSPPPPEPDPLYSSLVANVPGAVYRSEATAPWRDLFVSDHVLALCGYSAYELSRPGGTAFGDLILEEDRPVVEESVAREAEHGGTFEIRYRIRHADGDIRWMLDRGRVVRGADGRPPWLEGVIVDITEQMEAVNALRESEQRFRTLVANVPGGVYRCQVQWPYRDILLSEGVESITGYSVSQHRLIPELDFAGRVVPGDRARIEAVVEAAIRDRSTFSLRYRIHHADGGVRWVHEQGRATYDADGTPLFLDGVLLDVTAQMLAEQSLQEREERLRTIVENEPECVKLLDRTGNLLEMNPAGLGMIEAESLEQVQGHRVSDIVSPADRAAFGEMLDAVFRGERRTLTFEITGLKGTRRILETHSVPLWEDLQHKRVRALLGVTRDITGYMAAAEALRASEARLVEAQRIAGIGSWELDLRSGTLLWSGGIYRIFELDPAEFEATYDAFLATVHPDDRELVDRTYTEAVEQRKPYDLVHRLLMPDGRVKYVHERAETRYDAEGRPARSMGTVQDITERRQVEQARHALETQLRQSQKMEAIGTLAGGIAHDFNNILTAIMGHAELLSLDLPPSSRMREEVDGVLGASQRARDLVQQILTFSRRREQERKLIALQPVVLEALRMLRATLPTTIEIQTEIGSEGSLVMADATQIHQVVVNLCTNAAHAMRERGGVLSVHYGRVQVDEVFAQTHRDLHPGSYVRLTVSDTGHGMDPRTLERIFDPFFTTKAPGEGTGLGLAVVHGIMQHHDGLVTVYSQPDKGTSFNLYFPAAAGSASADSLDPRCYPRGAGEHILVVDDEPALVEIARRALTQLGYRVTGHIHPAAALAAFRQDPGMVDLVFCDLTMPQVGGLDFAAQLFQLRPDTPVVLTSGYSGSLEPEELRRLGIRELVGKPFTIQTLADAVHRNLSPTA